MQKFDFKPKISEKSKQIAGNRINFQERLKIIKKKEKLKIEKLERMRKEKVRNETKECTFSPKILRKKNRSGKVFEKLYNTHKEKQEIIQEKFLETQKDKLQKELENCTFKPHFHSNYKEKGIINYYK